MPDEFEQIRSALINGSTMIVKDPALAKMLDNILDSQRVIMATLATIVRGGQVPIDIARDLHERAKKITAILEG